MSFRTRTGQHQHGTLIVSHRRFLCTFKILLLNSLVFPSLRELERQLKRLIRHAQNPLYLLFY